MRNPARLCHSGRLATDALGSSAQLVPGDSAAAAELGRELAVLIDGV